MPAGYSNQFGVSTGKVQVDMGVSELVVIALLGLALFGGGIKIRFKGIARRSEKKELKNEAQRLLDK